MQDLELISKMLKQPQFVYHYTLYQKDPFLPEKSLFFIGNPKYAVVGFEIDSRHNFARFYFQDIEQLKDWIEKYYSISFNDIVKDILGSTYALVTYDNDHDLYSPLQFFTSEEEAISKGIQLYTQYKSGYSIIRNELNEPVDWLEIIHTKDFDTENYRPIWTSYQYEQEQISNKECLVLG